MHRKGQGGNSRLWEEAEQNLGRLGWSMAFGKWGAMKETGLAGEKAHAVGWGGLRARVNC